jgi:hypothetical protein
MGIAKLDEYPEEKKTQPFMQKWLQLGKRMGNLDW